MKKAIIATVCSILVVALIPCAAAGEAEDQPNVAVKPEAIVYDAASALEFFKSLSGDWESGSDSYQHGSNSPVVSFKTVAAGSTVIETVLEGQPNEMSSVFHMDGDQLLLTHYCALENAPVLRFEPSGKPGRIDFVFHGGTNFDPEVDAHFHEGTFLVKDVNTFESTFVVYANGEAQPEGRSLLRRSQSE